MNQWMLIGHRGVGKSTLLKALELSGELPEFSFFSLDQVIEEGEKKSIPEIFTKYGEASFRDLEKKYLTDLFKKNKDVIVDIGAGFVGAKPEGVKALWVSRPTDSSQYQFLDRPALDGQIKIPKVRWQEREKRYREFADFEIEIEETRSAFDKSFLSFCKSLITGRPQSLSLEKWMLTFSEDGAIGEAKHLLGSGLGKIELRDDLLSRQKGQVFIDGVGTGINEEALLVSHRDEKSWFKKVLNQNSSLIFDWPLEFGENIQAPILSLHKRDESLQDTLKRLDALMSEKDYSKTIVKLAVDVPNFEDLILGHRWRMKDPARRCFLPMSSTGRWHWYRLLHSQTSPLNFLRLKKGSALDQPSLAQVLNFNAKHSIFAAILGSPVLHSLTPSFHRDYFAKKDANVLAVDIEADEVNVALPFLKELGLRWAAVTSPLKEAVAAYTKSDLEAVNTLFFDNQTWHSTSTDIDGLNDLISAKDLSNTVVWGGGGTLHSLGEKAANFVISPSVPGRFGNVRVLSNFGHQN